MGAAAVLAVLWAQIAEELNTNIRKRPAAATVHRCMSQRMADGHVADVIRFLAKLDHRRGSAEVPLTAARGRQHNAEWPVAESLSAAAIVHLSGTRNERYQM